MVLLSLLSVFACTVGGCVDIYHVGVGRVSRYYHMWVGSMYETGWLFSVIVDGSVCASYEGGWILYMYSVLVGGFCVCICILCEIKVISRS